MFIHGNTLLIRKSCNRKTWVECKVRAIHITCISCSYYIGFSCTCTQTHTHKPTQTHASPNFSCPIFLFLSMNLYLHRNIILMFGAHSRLHVCFAFNLIWKSSRQNEWWKKKTPAENILSFLLPDGLGFPALPASHPCQELCFDVHEHFCFIITVISLILHTHRAELQQLYG